jgi:hypothetical protein
VSRIPLSLGSMKKRWCPDAGVPSPSYTRRMRHTTAEHAVGRLLSRCLAGALESCDREQRRLRAVAGGRRRVCAGIVLRSRPP